MTSDERQPANFAWRCSRCATVYAPGAVRYACPACGDMAALDMVPNYARIRARWGLSDLAGERRFSMWRYAPLLTLQQDVTWVAAQPALSGVGWTPLYQAERLGQTMGLHHLYIKDDGRNPTGSLKDRASALVVAQAREQGETTIATASSGNAAAALAGLGAAAGMRCIIFVPKAAPEAKVAQLLIYGAKVLLIDGSYDDAVDLCLAACKTWGWYCRNTAYNPHTAEGKKTVALEIVEQLGGQTPDTVIVSVGDGNIITGLHRGFADALALGWISSMPRLIGVQATAASALYQAWNRGASEVTPAAATTLADSINVGLPRDGWRALRAVRQTGGSMVAVDDYAILAAMRMVARTTGIFTEPACAATFAGLGLLASQGEIKADERVVVVNTGNGLKDVAAAGRATVQPQVIAPTLEAVEAAMK